jgi:phosphoribosylformylglycinamidine synthase
MAHRLEIAMKPGLRDPQGESVQKRARDYFDLPVESVRVVQILTIDADLGPEQLRLARERIFTNPVTQVSSYQPLAGRLDFALWVGLRPGVRDTAGSTAKEALLDFPGLNFPAGGEVYTSQLYLLNGPRLGLSDAETMARELLANDIIQLWRVYAPEEWDPKTGVGYIIPKVVLGHEPTVTEISIGSDEELLAISRARDLALNPNDVPTIRAYVLRPEVLAARALVGLSAPTDVELEYLAQSRSDHCNHNTFNGLFHYRDAATGKEERVDNLFKTCIVAPTRKLAAEKSWVASVLWDNAGVFPDRHRGRLSRPHGHRPGLAHHPGHLRLLCRAARLRRAAPAAPPPPPPPGRRHRGRQGRREQKRHPHALRPGLFPSRLHGQVPRLRLGRGTHAR